jgi:hypothetical protein
LSKILALERGPRTYKIPVCQPHDTPRPHPSRPQRKNQSSFLPSHTHFPQGKIPNLSPSPAGRRSHMGRRSVREEAAAPWSAAEGSNQSRTVLDHGGGGKEVRPACGKGAQPACGEEARPVSCWRESENPGRERTRRETSGAASCARRCSPLPANERVALAARALVLGGAPRSAPAGFAALLATPTLSVVPNNIVSLRAPYPSSSFMGPDDGSRLEWRRAAATTAEKRELGRCRLALEVARRKASRPQARVLVLVNGVCRGSLPPTVNLYRSRVGLRWLRKWGVHRIYTGSGLRRVTPYVQLAVLFALICSGGYKWVREGAWSQVSVV